MEIGIDSFAALNADPKTGQMPSPAERMGRLLEEIETAEGAGLDSFGLGEHHRSEYIDSSAAVILAAAAARTERIRLHSAVTVLSAADPVRIFQDYATLDLISKGRAEIVAGRGSFTEAFPLFGLRLEDYGDLFIEKLDLLLELVRGNPVHWSGRFRPALTGQSVYPRPHQNPLPVWLGAGGTPESFARAGRLGIPLMVAIIGGRFDSFRPLVDLYRAQGQSAGHPPERLRVGVHAMGFVAQTGEAARDAFYPGWAEAFTKIGRERGWAPVSRAQFEVMCRPGGAYLIGDPDEVAAKALAMSAALGGVSRIQFQMSTASGDHGAMMRSIELLGSEVRPLVNPR